MKNVVIFDLDGTLAIIDHRRYLVERPVCPCCKAEGFVGFMISDNGCSECGDSGEDRSFKPNWSEFYRQCVNDLPNNAVIEALKAHYIANHNIVIFSGRSAEVRKETEDWLYTYVGSPYDAWATRQNNFAKENGLKGSLFRPLEAPVLMRPKNDFTPDQELKRYWLNENQFFNKEDVLCAYDDRNKVVTMWRSEGIPCFQVAPGNF